MSLFYTIHSLNCYCEQTVLSLSLESTLFLHRSAFGKVVSFTIKFDTFNKPSLLKATHS